ncbi:hypothetical protein HZH66_013977 [Vespula vulgaris]|uniref:Uncharacterized protein n=1 Tax=Vespula vulgaris TaxID=7454 RepID=A0A834J452_VESVU|nr:hypothetical protein HZH66_013977 [Vespula vulgaris]
MVRARKRNSWEQLQLERIASRVNIKTMPNIEKFEITDVKVGVAALVKPEKTSRLIKPHRNHLKPKYYARLISIFNSNEAIPYLSQDKKQI